MYMFNELHKLFNVKLFDLIQHGTLINSLAHMTDIPYPEN